MKDQIRLLRACINNDIPAVVFQGDDKCAPEILEAAINIYKKNGCSQEFLYDFQLLLDEVKAYQKENPGSIKLPGLSASEIELIQADMKKKKTQICNAWELEAMKAAYKDYSIEKLVSGKFVMIEYGKEKTRRYGIISDRLHRLNPGNTMTSQCWFYPFTGGCISFDIKTGIRHENCKIVGIENTSDEIAKSRYDTCINYSIL